MIILTFATDGALLIGEARRAVRSPLWRAMLETCVTAQYTKTTMAQRPSASSGHQIQYCISGKVSVLQYTVDEHYYPTVVQSLLKQL